MDRRTLFRGGIGLTAAAVTGLAAAPALAESASSDDALDFIPADATTAQVADLLFEGAPAAEREAYIELATSKHPDLSGREQLRAILHDDAGSEPSNDAITPRALPILPAAGIAARALIAAARRYGPAVFNSLKNAVGKGYSAFNAWLAEHQFAGGIIVGISASAIYDALKSILF